MVEKRNRGKARKDNTQRRATTETLLPEMARQLEMEGLFLAFAEIAGHPVSDAHPDANFTWEDSFGKDSRYQLTIGCPFANDKDQAEEMILTLSCEGTQIERVVAHAAWEGSTPAITKFNASATNNDRPEKLLGAKDIISVGLRFCDTLRAMGFVGNPYESALEADLPPRQVGPSHETRVKALMTYLIPTITDRHEKNASNQPITSFHYRTAWEQQSETGETLQYQVNVDCPFATADGQPEEVILTLLCNGVQTEEVVTHVKEDGETAERVNSYALNYLHPEWFIGAEAMTMKAIEAIDLPYEEPEFENYPNVPVDYSKGIN